MTEMTDHEARWLYAKGLELAILLKGAPGNIEKDEYANGIIDLRYQKLASYVIQRIVDNGRELRQKGRIQVNYP